MKIVQVVNHFHPCFGGKESIAKGLALQLKKAGHRVEVVCLNKCADSSAILASHEEWHGIKIHRVPFTNLHFLKIGFPPFGVLRSADIVHVHGICFLSDFLALKKVLYRKPLVLSTHGGIFHTKTLSALKKLYFNVWLRILGRAFDKVIAVSENDFELFSRIFPAEKMALVENAVEVEKFLAVKRASPDNSFLFVGRLSRNKRIDLLLDAFALFLKRKDGTLTVAGKDFDNILPGLREKAKELGIERKVRFEGEVSEQKLLGLFSSHSFFVSASSYEGFGVSAIEAMAAGLVPLLNDIPSFRGFVQEGGNGFIVDFGNAKGAAAKMEKACSLGSAKLQEMSNAARQSVQRFSWKERVKEFEKIYNSLAFTS